MPRAVTDAGYTAVGLGVLALAQVHLRRRQLEAQVGRGLALARRQAEGLLAQAARELDRLPLPLPLPPDGFAGAVRAGRDQLRRLLADPPAPGPALYDQDRDPEQARP